MSTAPENERPMRLVESAHRPEGLGSNSTATIADQALPSQGELKSHHPSYDRPAFVIWLCRRCHRGEHRRQKGGGA